MNSNDWLRLARSKRVHQKIKKDHLLPLYGSVIKQFAAWNQMTWDNAVVGLHVVYGWMPTIPKFKRATRWPDKQKSVVRLLNKARVKTLEADELEIIKENLVNNSVVGTSKFLHLLAPNKYAIWDRRVAKVWYASKTNPPSCYVQAGEYLKYNNELNHWLANKEAKEEISNQIRCLQKMFPDLGKASDLRVLELVLFHAK